MDSFLWTCEVGKHKHRPERACCKSQLVQHSLNKKMWNKATGRHWHVATLPKWLTNILTAEFVKKKNIDIETQLRKNNSDPVSLMDHWERTPLTLRPAAASSHSRSCVISESGSEQERSWMTPVTHSTTCCRNFPSEKWETVPQSNSQKTLKNKALMSRFTLNLKN